MTGSTYMKNLETKEICFFLLGLFAANNFEAYTWFHQGPAKNITILMAVEQIAIISLVYMILSFVTTYLNWVFRNWSEFKQAWRDTQLF